MAKSVEMHWNNSSKKKYPSLLQYLRLALAGAWLPYLEQIDLLCPSDPASGFSTVGIDCLLQKEECSSFGACQGLRSGMDWCAVRKEEGQDKQGKQSQKCKLGHLDLRFLMSSAKPDVTT